MCVDLRRKAKKHSELKEAERLVLKQEDQVVVLFLK